MLISGVLPSSPSCPSTPSLPLGPWAGIPVSTTPIYQLPFSPICGVSAGVPSSPSRPSGMKKRSSSITSPVISFIKVIVTHVPVCPLKFPRSVLVSTPGKIGEGCSCVSDLIPNSMISLTGLVVISLSFK